MKFGCHDDLRQLQASDFSNFFKKFLVDLKSLFNKKYSPREEKVRSVQRTDKGMNLPK